MISRNLTMISRVRENSEVVMKFTQIWGIEHPSPPSDGCYIRPSTSEIHVVVGENGPCLAGWMPVFGGRIPLWDYVYTYCFFLVS
jgi:hypothetical protein